MSESSSALLSRLMTLHPKVIDLTLDRMWRLLDALGNPQDKLPPVIHIAGTNGKGSTQAMLRAGFEAEGKKVHAYTSPHLARFHERIRLAGEMIAEDHLIDVLQRCEAANAGAEVTFFDITTCAAILAFSETLADVTLLEVGMGGRLDSTNVVTNPAMTVITPVSKDHEAYLGTTIAEIAGEKAGIIKRGVPCVVGPQEDDALEVIEATAARLGAPVMAHGQHWHVSEERGRLVYQDDNGLRDLPLPSLPGAHQLQNAGAAVAVLRAMEADEAAFEGAMTNAEWPARMQRLKTGPLVEMAGGAEIWLDGGHNPAAGKALSAHLKTLPKRPIYMICGMLNTKDATGYMAPFNGLIQELHAVPIPEEANALPTEDAAQMARDAGLTAFEADDVQTALQTILEQTPNARILICGSLYLAGYILRSHG